MPELFEQPSEKARRGIYAAAISPLNADGSLNGPGLAEYCHYLMSDAGGCDGAAPLGTTGESTSLAMKDRLAAPGYLADGGLPSERIIIGTGAPSVADAVELTRAALDAGYNNVLVLPPYYFKNPSDDGLYAAYSTLIERVGQDRLRVYLYHFPQMSTIPLSVSLVTRLKAAFGPVIAGLKDSTGDFEVSRAFIEATGGISNDFDVFPANEVFLPEGIAIGSAGTISGTTNAFGALAKHALSLEQGAERDAAEAKMAAARGLAARFNNIAAMKQIAAWRTGNEDWLRLLPPLLPLSADEASDLKAGLDAL